jgi:hypothetical protein
MIVRSLAFLFHLRADIIFSDVFDSVLPCCHVATLPCSFTAIYFSDLMCSRWQDGKMASWQVFVCTSCFFDGAGEVV